MNYFEEVGLFCCEREFETPHGTMRVAEKGGGQYFVWLNSIPQFVVTPRGLNPKGRTNNETIYKRWLKISEEK